VAYINYNLPVDRGVGHHAPSIRLGDFDFSIMLSLESHRHLRTSIIDSIVGELVAVLLTDLRQFQCPPCQRLIIYAQALESAWHP
jgi:hypothetical protein